MSRAYMEIKDPLQDHPFAPVDIPAAAQWWRLPLEYGRALPDGNLLVQEIDDVKAPRVMTYTFNDGEDEDIAPLAIRHSTETDNCRHTYRVINVRSYLDVLAVGPPTASSWWMELTRPGNHWHPDYGKMPRAERVAKTIRQSDLFRQGVM